MMTENKNSPENNSIEKTKMMDEKMKAKEKEINVNRSSSHSKSMRSNRSNRSSTHEANSELAHVLAKHKSHVSQIESLHINCHYKAEIEFGRDDFQRTNSIISYLSGTEDDQIQTKTYKYITTAALWFCYFSLALNDYIFGPTFDDLSKILGVKFEEIAHFATIRQVAYTAGALGGFSFNYINRQMALILLLLLSSITLVVTPFSPSLTILFVTAAVNGFAAGACDIGFHVWILEMFEDAGGPLLQALHFAFGIGITIAPLITSPFLSEGESVCQIEDDQNSIKMRQKPQINDKLYIPYCISASIIAFGAIILLTLFCYKKYVPPVEPKVPQAFDEKLPKNLSRKEKLELWKKNVPSYYIIGIIGLGSLIVFSYYGLEVTYFQFTAQFITATPLPISGSSSAYVEAAMGGAYAFGGAISIYLSTRLYPQQMLYVNFFIIITGCLLLLFVGLKYITMLWIGNIIVGLGFSSTYASIYTFLEHQIPVTNVIGSIFQLAGGSGTAIFPLLLAKLCENSLLIVDLCLGCTFCSIVIFIVLHIITNRRGKQVDMIKKKFLKSPAILLAYKERKFSHISNYM